MLYVGKARSIRKRVASHFSGPHRGGLDFIGRVGSIDFLVTETEAEALLAEQQFIKRHRPRFNIRLRDDKSYPYIGVSLDEEFPRVYFTRERHRSGRVYFGPFSSASRVRETLDLLGKLFQYRTCEGPEPGRRSGVPCLDYYIKRCQAPCVGYIDREEYRRNIEAIVDFLSGRYRDVERDLERKMAEASAGEEFERAAVLPRPARGGALADASAAASPASRSSTADLIAVAVEGADANAQVFQVRDGVLAERQGFYLANEGERERGRGDRGVHRPVLLGGAGGAPAGRRRPGAARPRRAARRGAARAAAAARSRCGSPSAATSAGCASSPSATRGSRSPRTGCARSAAASSGSTRSPRCRRRSGSSRCRCGSRASTSPTSAPSTPWPRWSSSRAARRRSPTTAGSRSGAIAADATGRRTDGPDDFASIEEVLARRIGALPRAGRPARRTTPSATRASPRCPT